MQAPTPFQKSCSNFERYPSNLIQQPLYAGSTVAYETKLKNEDKKLKNGESRLFHNPKAEPIAKFREIKYSGQDPAKSKTVFNDQEFQQWLECQSLALSNPLSGALAAQADPKCRFIFLCLDSSRSPLKITRRSLLRLLTYHQVMSEFVDFISVFGTQEGPADPMFASFCEKTSLTPNPALHIPQLGRSGRQLQLCYMLRAPAPKTNRYGRNLEWSLRPTAIHHQFDIVEGTTLWTVIRGGEDIYEKIKYLTDEFGRPEDRDMSNAATSFRASLLIHLLVAFWAMEQWKPYVVWLDSIVKERTGSAAYGDRSQSLHRYDHNPDEFRLIQLLEDEITLAIAVLEGNIRVAKMLSNYYQELPQKPDFLLGSSCGQHIHEFTHELNSTIEKMQIDLNRAKFLVKIVADRKGLILQYLQHQENEKTNLLTISMRQIGLKSHREALAMSIITVVTLVYLPGTFVSTKKAFFSTDVVKYQGGNAFSYTALMRWLEVTLPLTAVTLVLAYIWFRTRDRRKEQYELQDYVMEKSLPPV